MNTLRFVGLATVAIKKEPEVDVVKVYPQELLPDAVGNVAEDITLDGVTQSMVLEATYWPTDAYTMEAPMVVEGDKVVLLQHSDTQQYYWITHERVRTRRTTQIEHWYPAKKEHDVYDSPSNNYTTRLDTDAGILNLDTTRANDEKTEYNITLNTKQGVFSFTTDTGDKFTWDNVKKKLDITTDSCTLSLKSLTVDAKDIKINANNINVNADRLSISANVSIRGDTSIRGSTRLIGSASISGSLKVGGGIRSGGTISASVVRASYGGFPNVKKYY